MLKVLMCGLSSSSPGFKWNKNSETKFKQVLNTPNFVLLLKNLTKLNSLMIIKELKMLLINSPVYY